MTDTNTVNREVKNMIYEIRGKQVMLDSDLAKLYGCTNGTKEINQTTKRNIKKFPEDYYFQLSEEEFFDLRSQTVTANRTMVRSIPCVFTEEGITILSTVLKSENSKKISEQILNTFKNLNKSNLPESPKIKELIYEIRGEQVMFDFDLAKLYQCTNGTKEINQAVKNNIEKFPKRFSWVLDEEDFCNLRSKILTSSLENNYGGRRYNYRVFTEQGVAMPATILKSKKAIEVSIQIMDTFVAMRKYISTNLIQQKYINDLVIKDNKRIDLLEETFSKFEKKKEATEIYFNGQIFDAYSKIQEIFSQAKNKLTIIDAYADNTILDIIKRLTV